MTKFEIGDGYKTRDGRDAGTYWIGRNQIHGWIASTSISGRTAEVWNAKGKTYESGDANSDLMPKKRGVWLVWFESENFNYPLICTDEKAAIIKAENQKGSVQYVEEPD